MDKPVQKGPVRRPQSQGPEPWRSWGDTLRYVFIRVTLVAVPMILMWLLYRGMHHVL